MIYISSSCVKNKTIKESVIELAENGFKNIELSGGTEFYDGFENDLMDLKDKYSLNYICHNYFPPPIEHFVLNLASLNDVIYKKTLDHLANSVSLSKRLGAKRFGFHAGFFIDINVNEIGGAISKDNTFEKNEAIKRFCDGYRKLSQSANGIDLYIENNVFSSTNSNTYDNENIFMLTNSLEFDELRSEIDFNLLLDIAHLKVSSRTLNLEFEREFSYLVKQSDYIHISDNDALHDLNYGVRRGSKLEGLLRMQDVVNKDFTLEVYDGIERIHETNELLQEMVG